MLANSLLDIDMRAGDWNCIFNMLAAWYQLGTCIGARKPEKSALRAKKDEIYGECCLESTILLEGTNEKDNCVLFKFVKTL